LGIEKNSLNNFQYHYGNRLNELCDRNDMASVLALMQHYRAPTRLLDWTRSPYVAAYFAVEDQWNKDGAIWFFNGGIVQDLAELHFMHAYPEQRKEIKPPDFFQVDPELPTFLKVLSATLGNERMIAQQGLFTISTFILDDHAERIQRSTANLVDLGTDHIGVIKISAALKPKFLNHLKYMNISANALFPGMDGVGRSVAESVHLDSFAESVRLRNPATMEPTPVAQNQPPDPQAPSADSRSEPGPSESVAPQEGSDPT
jgi:hypothetical protein